MDLLTHLLSPELYLFSLPVTQLHRLFHLIHIFHLNTSFFRP